MRRGPLFELHKAAGATFAGRDGWELPVDFSSPLAELKTLKGTVGLLDLTGRGVLGLRGSDRLDFVQRLSTNDVLGLAPGQGVPTVFTTPIGRIVDLAVVLPRQEDLLLIAGRGADELLTDWLRRHIFFNDDVVVENVTAEWSVMACLGPHAAELLETTVDPELSRLAPYHTHSGQIDGNEVTVISALPWPGGYGLLTPADRAPAVWHTLEEAVASAGGRPAGEKALETVRVGAGRPRFGRELTEDYIPLETGLKWAVNFDKGCYVGQEIIARLDTHQRLAKRLVVLGWRAATETTGAVWRPGDEVWTNASKVGQTTSVAPLIDHGMQTALAYVKTGVAEPGHELILACEGGKLTATVLAVPGSA